MMMWRNVSKYDWVERPSRLPLYQLGASGKSVSDKINSPRGEKNREKEREKVKENPKGKSQPTK